MFLRKIIDFAKRSNSPDELLAGADKIHPAAVVEALEQRIMYSADALALPLVDTSTDSDLPLGAINTQPAPDKALLPELETPSTTIGYSAEIVFVDSGTPGLDSLLADLAAQQNEGRSLQVVMINSEDDGIKVITDTLASLSNVFAVHIISHGNESGLSLGSSWVDENEAQKYANQIVQWQDALSDDADLLLYGCNLASSAQGIELLNTLSDYSKADVAASSNSTGHAFFQGDWNLEYSIGTIETEIALSETLQDRWSNELALDLLAVDDDFGPRLTDTAIVLNDPINAPDTNILGNDQTSASSIQLLNVSEPTAGTINENEGVFTYVPPLGHTGNESFDYVISDTTQPVVHHFSLDTSTTSDLITGTETESVPLQNQPSLNGTELEFDGNDYIEITDLTYPSEFTLSMDFKVGDITPGKIEMLFQHGYEFNENSVVAYITGKHLVVRVTDSNDQPSLNFPAYDITAFSNTDTWQTLTITHAEHPASGPTEETRIEIYLNGINQDAYEPGWTIANNGWPYYQQPRGGDPINPTTNIFVGKYQYSNGSSSHYLDDHQIRDIKLYDELISPNAASQPIDYSAGTVEVSLRDPNQAPSFSALGTNKLYIEGQSPVIIESEITLSDAELTTDNNFNGSTLALQRVGGANSEDTFTTNSSLSPLIEGLPLIHNDPTTGDTTVGMVTTNGGGLLEIAFTGNASNSLVNSVLQAISYSNSSNSPPVSVDIEWNFNDGFTGPAEFGGSLSATATTTITIEETPDFNIAAPISQIHTDEDTPYIFNNDISIIHDQHTAAAFSMLLSVDNGTLSTTALPTITVTGNNTSSLLLRGPVDDHNQTLQSVSYRPDNDYNGTDELIISGAFDSEPSINPSVSTDILINSINDTPVISSTGSAVFYDATTSVPVFIDSNITITDSELGTSGNYENTSINLVRINATGTANGHSVSADAEDNFTAPTLTGNLQENSDLVDGDIFGIVQKNSNGELQLMFNANANKTKIDTLLQSIQYNSNSPWPPVEGDWPSNTVELQWSFNDNGNDEFSATGVLGTQTGTAQSAIDITAPGYPPQEITNNYLLIKTNTTAQPIDSTFLEFIDPDSTPAEIIYTVSEINASAGTLAKNGNSISLNDTFSQQDINQGLLTYTPISADPITTKFVFDVADANHNTDSGSFTIITIDDVPTTLQSGVKLNVDGGNDAFLGETGDADFILTNQGWTREFTFSELSISNGNVVSTIYSTSGGTKFTGHYEYLVVKPDSTIEWYNKTLDAGGDPTQPSSGTPVLSASVPGILDGGLHTIAVTLDVRLGGEAQLFYDGTLIDTASNNLPNSVTWVGGYPLVFGQQLLPTSTLSTPGSFNDYDFVTGAHFSGVLHEARFWNDLRTQAEIHDNKNARLEYNSVITPNLVANWHMFDPNGDETVNNVVNLAPGKAGQTTTSTLVVGHATGASFTTSTPTDTLFVDDTAANGTVVGYVTPLDPMPDPAGYEYSIPLNSLPTAFSINSATGEIVVSDSSLLSETDSHYYLAVRVKSTDISGVTQTEDITLKIYAINETPTITLTGTTPINYTEGDDPVTIDSGIIITDAELETISFGGSTVSIERYEGDTPSANTNDVFSSNIFSTPTSLFTTSQSNGKLVATFGAGSTAADVNNVLQSIEYQNTSDNPVSNVQLQWVFNDGNFTSQGAGGALEARATTDVSITPVNDIPILGRFSSPLTNTAEDTTIAIGFSDLQSLASDVDGEVTKFEIVNIINGELIVGETFATAGVANTVESSETIYWTPPPHENGLQSAFQLLAVDNFEARSDTPRLVNIQVDSVSDHPEGTNQTLDIVEDSNQVLSLGDFGFTDKDGDLFTSVNISAITDGSIWVSGTELSVPARVDSTDILAGVVYYQPDQDHHSHNAEIHFEVIDSGLNSTDVTTNVLSIRVASVNDAPAAQNKTISLMEDEQVNLLTTDFGFTDTADISPEKPDGDNPYSITFEAIPSHGTLTFNKIPLVAGDEVLYSSLQSGSLVFQPELHNHTDTWIDFKVTDNGGIDDGGQNTSTATNRIDLPILSVNDSPSGKDQKISVLEGAIHTFVATDFGFTDIADNDNFQSIQLHNLPSAGFLALSGTAITTLNSVSKTDIDNGLLTYIPPIHTQGTVDTTFAYFMQDDGGTNNGGINTDPNANIATISNQGINDPPVLNIINAISVTEDTAYTFSITDFVFSDQENHNLQGVEIVSLPSNGILSADGQNITSPIFIAVTDISSAKLVYTPDLHNTGTPADSFHFRVQDDGGVMNGGVDFALTSQPMSININNISDQPVAADFSIDVIEGNFHTFTTVNFGFSDTPENDDLKSILIEKLPTAGTLTLSGSVLTIPTTISKTDIEAGQFIYLPPDTEHDENTSFRFKVQDTGNSGLNTSNSSYTATIINIDVNDPPLTASNNAASTVEDTSYTFEKNDFVYADLENHLPLNIIIDSLPTSGSLSVNSLVIKPGDIIRIPDIENGRLAYKANPDSTATDSFLYRLQDNGGTLNGGIDTALLSQNFTINITPINDHPTASNFNFNVTEDVPHIFKTSQFSFSDTTDQHALKALAIQSLPDEGSLILEGIPLVIPSLINVQDIDAGLFQYVPPEHTKGNVDTTFTFTVQDNGGVTYGGVDTDPNSYNATITNLGVNDPPTPHSNNRANALEDTPYYFELSDFEFNDPEKHQLKRVIIDAPNLSGSLLFNGTIITSDALISAAEISANLLSYKPPANATGLAVDTIFYRVQDDGGTLNGGIDTALDLRPLTIDLLNVNDPPISYNHRIYTLEDTPYQFVATDFPYSDTEADPLKEVIIHSTSEGRLEVNGTVVGIGSAVSANDINTGNFQYIPPANINGVSADTFSFFIKDTAGTLNNGLDTSVANYTISIDIAPVNDSPQARDGLVVALEDSTVKLGRDHFSFTDIDDDDIAGVQIVSVPQTGQLTLNGSAVTGRITIAIADIEAGNLTFTPTPNTHGINYTDFAFQLFDDGIATGANSDEAPNVITINVVSVSDAPVAQNNEVLLREDSVHIYSLGDFQYTDLADAPFENTIISIKLLAIPISGNLRLNDQPVAALDIISAQDIDLGRLTFSPLPDTHGDQYASLKFQIIDSGSTEHGGKNISATTATSGISITAENDAPQAFSDNLVTTESGAFNSKDSNLSLIDNDTDIDTDALLSVSLLDPPTHGQLQLNADGSFLYSHDGSETSEDEFTYQLSDGILTDEAKVHISILPLNDAPVSQPLDQYSLNEKQLFQLQLPETLFSDPDPNDLLNITLATGDGGELPPWISFDQNAMQINGTPVEAGTFAFTLTATDAGGASTMTTLYLTVTAESIPEIAAAQETPLVDITIPPEPAHSSTGKSTGLAIIEPKSLAIKNQTIPETTPDDDRPEDIHTQIKIPQLQVSEEILVFAANTVAKHPERIIATPAIEVPNQNIAETLVPLSDLFEIKEPQSTSSVGKLTRELDGNSDSMSRSTEFNLKVASTTIGVSAGLSIGYIVWLLRGGLLLGSVLSSLPAWRSLDPLPVLDSLNEHDDNSDDESLEELVNTDDDTEQQIEDQKVEVPVDDTKEGDFNDIQNNAK